MSDELTDLIFFRDIEGISKLLAANKELINGGDEYGRRHISLAAACNYIDVVQAFLDAGADIDLPNTDNLGYTPLMEAANEGKTAMIRFLLDKGASIEATDTIGGTALLRACVGAYADALELLIEKGADVNAIDQRGYSPLHYICQNAANWGSMKIYDITENGEEIERPNPRIYEHLEIVKILVKNGAHINSISGNGYSALHFSAHSGNEIFLDELIAIGADADIVNGNGYSPLHAAADNGHLSCAKLLVSKGADVNREDKYGFRPIHGATESGNKELVKFLMEKGADPLNKVKEGYGEIQAGFTAADIAKLRNNIEILELFNAN